MNRSRYLGFYFMIEASAIFLWGCGSGGRLARRSLENNISYLAWPQNIFFSCLLQLDITLFFYSCPLLII
jgi:hypothetical protein